MYTKGAKCILLVSLPLHTCRWYLVSTVA